VCSQCLAPSPCRNPLVSGAAAARYGRRMVWNAISALSRAAREFEIRLESVESEHWDSASDCEGWSVADLVDHVVGGNAFTSQLLLGATTQEAMSAAIDYANAGVANRRLAYRHSADEMLDLLAAADADGHLILHPAGVVPTNVVMTLRTFDITLHAWDLARSVGSNEILDGDLVTHVLACTHTYAREITASGGHLVQLDPAPSADVTEQELLLMRSGRRDQT
jgi:uncharacterized protein (TIGR03086 family)